MSSVSSTSAGRSAEPVRWVAEHIFFLVAAVYLIVNGILFITCKTDSSEWDQVFVLAAKKLISGADIYSVAPWSKPVERTPGDVYFQITHPFTYPPFHALTAIPVLPLPHLLSRLSWFLVLAISLSVMWILSWRLTGGKPLNRANRSGVEVAICLLGLIAGMRYVQGVFGHEQSDLLIDALLLGGCYAWAKRRDFLAATAWGFAAAFKGPPLLMAPYLAWRGRWLAAAWTIVLAVALNLVPDAIHRAPQGLWANQWYSQIIKPTSGQIGAWVVDPIINQSVAGAGFRFFTMGWYFDHSELNFTYGKQRLNPHVQKAIVYAIDAALMAAVAYALGRPFRKPTDETTAVLECATVFILMLLLSPMSHLTHFGILMLPGFIVARMAIEKVDRVAIAAVLVMLVVIGLLDRFPYSPVGKLAAWYGNVMWGAVALGVACCWGLVERRKKAGATALSHRSPQNGE